jgi:hypothetical protein
MDTRIGAKKPSTSMTKRSCNAVSDRGTPVFDRPQRTRQERLSGDIAMNVGVQPPEKEDARMSPHRFSLISRLCGNDTNHQMSGWKNEGIDKALQASIGDRDTV